MEESVTYQALIRRGENQGMQQGLGLGRIDEARRAVVRIGQKRFQKPIPQEISNRLESITDRDQLESLLDRTLDVSNWDELMKTE